MDEYSQAAQTLSSQGSSVRLAKFDDTEHRDMLGQQLEEFIGAVTVYPSILPVVRGHARAVHIPQQTAEGVVEFA